MKKIIVLPQKQARLIALLKPVAKPEVVIAALEREEDIRPLPVQSRETVWDKARTKLMTAASFSPSEKAEFRKMIELINSEDLVDRTIHHYQYLTDHNGDELILLIRKVAETI
ncbi:MAG: hypothetical protein JWL92_679 [Candidatus Nomurabacteria bacterium]|nr:hypothetical protein [Candidatus Nomurabacteria bacterium]